MIPVAEAISNAPSVASIPALPTKWRRAGSHSPSDAEIERSRIGGVVLDDCPKCEAEKGEVPDAG